MSAESKMDTVANWLYRVMYSASTDALDSESGHMRLHLLRRRVAEAMHTKNGPETPQAWLMDALGPGFDDHPNPDDSTTRRHW